MNDQNEDLLNEIIELTRSPQSRIFYLENIRSYGEGLIRETLGEFRYLLKTKSDIETPASYFTGMLKNLNGQKLKLEAKEKKKNGCFFDHPLEPYSYSKEEIKNPAVLYNGRMTNTFSQRGIPWPTTMGPEYFSLSNKIKSDSVKTTIRCNDGNKYEVTMVRGKLFKDAEPSGIMSADIDTNILEALTAIWVKQGSRYTTGDEVKCFCVVSIRELAEEMGYQNFGGGILRHLKRRLDRLRKIGYYIDYTGVPGIGDFKDSRRGFSFIDSMQVIESGRGSTAVSLFRIKFSEFYSAMLLNRKVVTRAKINHRNQNGLSKLIQLYLESRIMNEPNGFSIMLVTLIKKLQLTPMEWHKYKSSRRKNFLAALKELNKNTTWEGDNFYASLIEHKEDHELKIRRSKIIDIPYCKGEIELKAGFICKQPVQPINYGPDPDVIERKEKEAGELAAKSA